MELYLFAALVLMYILMAIFVRKNVQLKVWTTAYIVSFIVSPPLLWSLRLFSFDIIVRMSKIRKSLCAHSTF